MIIGIWEMYVHAVDNTYVGRYQWSIIGISGILHRLNSYCIIAKQISAHDSKLNGGLMNLNVKIGM